MAAVGIDEAGVAMVLGKIVELELVVDTKEIRFELESCMNENHSNPNSRFLLAAVLVARIEAVLAIEPRRWARL